MPKGSPKVSRPVSYRDASPDPKALIRHGSLSKIDTAPSPRQKKNRTPPHVSRGSREGNATFATLGSDVSPSSTSPPETPPASRTGGEGAPTGHSPAEVIDSVQSSASALEAAADNLNVFGDKREIMDSLLRLVAVQREELVRIKSARGHGPELSELQRQLKLQTVRTNKAEQERMTVQRRFEELRAHHDTLEKTLSSLDTKHAGEIEEMRSKNKRDLLDALDETSRAQLAMEMLTHEAEMEREEAKNEELKLQQRAHDKETKELSISHEREVATLLASRADAEGVAVDGADGGSLLVSFEQHQRI